MDFPIVQDIQATQQSLILLKEAANDSQESELAVKPGKMQP